MATLAHGLQLVGGCVAPFVVFFLIRRESRFCKVSGVSGVAAAVRANDSHRRLRDWVVCSDPFEGCASSPAKRGGTAGNLFRNSIVLDRIYGPLGFDLGRRDWLWTQSWTR